MSQILLAGHAPMTLGEIQTITLMNAKDLAPLLAGAGSMGIRFRDLSISLETPTLTAVDSFSLPRVLVRGSYSVSASGNRRSPVAALSPGSGGNDDPYLQAARAQRERLWKTPGGARIMDKFYEHNETYNEVFTNPTEAFSDVWASAENRKQADRTYAATNNPSQPVNPDFEYNRNGFEQSTYLRTALNRMAKTAREQGRPDLRYRTASSAVGDFRDSVHDTTGNGYDDDNPSGAYRPMTVNQAYDTVQRHKDMPPPVHSREVTEFEKKCIAHYEELCRAKQGRLSASPVGHVEPVFQGTCEFQFADGQVSIRGARCVAVLPAPTLSIGNIEEWSAGELAAIGQQLKAALDRAAFLRILVRDRVQDVLATTAFEIAAGE